MKRHCSGCPFLVHLFQEQVVYEPQIVTIAVGFLGKCLVVVFQTEDVAIVIDPDQQGATVGGIRVKRNRLGEIVGREAPHYLALR